MVAKFVADTKISFLTQVLRHSPVACTVVLPGGASYLFGSGDSRFTLTVHKLSFLSQAFDELGFAESYINNDIDIVGDMGAVMQLRGYIKDKIPVATWLKFAHELLFRNETLVNRQAISDHYQHGNDLYLSFIDQRYRFYSQGIFKSPEDTLEQASEHKLEQMFEALQLKPGMRLLDIGGGWGGVAQYCGSRGVHVTELTLGEDSYQYIDALIKEQNLPCEVLLQDFLTYTPEQPFDAIVIYGVIEHIINYKRFTEKVWDALKPNGLLFLDASASVVKYDVSAFARKYIWTGTHTFLCLQELIQELLFGGMEVLRVVNESAHYGNTMRHWAERLDANRDSIVAQWGEPLYRAFRLYLWGGSEAFPEFLQAYHLVARKMPKKPPVPNQLRRWIGWIGR